MRNSKSVTKIMEELGLDPKNASQKAIIEELLASRPHVEINEQFVSELRDEIELRGRKLLTPKQSTNFFAFFMKKTIITAIVVLVVAVAGTTWFLRGSNPLGQQQAAVNQLLSSEYAVTDVAANSFGELTTANLSAENRSQSAGGTGGGNGINQVATSEDNKMIAPGEPTPGGDTLPYPQYEVYDFAYKGDDLTNLSNSEPVFRKVYNRQDGSLVSRIVNMLTLGVVDLSKFRDAQLDNFTIVEDRDMGYSVNVALTQGSVSIYQNWEKWPQPFSDCKTDACWQENRIKPEQVPSDEESIELANRFLDEYGIARTGYGQPRIQYNEWRIQYERAVDKTQIYLPEQVTVTYPLQLDGKTVYDESGNFFGLNVAVDVRTKLVASVYEITSRKFEKSSYNAETNADRLIKVAERGGYRNYVYDDPNGKKVTLELGTPSRQVVNMWYSKNNNGYDPGESIYVPALVFPIINVDKTNYWRKNVIVPLVKEILDSDDQQGGYPMPLATDGAAGAVQGVTSTKPEPTPTPTATPTKVN